MHVDVIVIGTGQAGLALGYHLAQQKRSSLLLDRATAIGDVRRQRYDSLVLFTPAWYNALPGMPFPEDSDHYPTKDKVAAYFQAYAPRYQLLVQLNTLVQRVYPVLDGYEVVTSQATYQAKVVVVATGPFHTPISLALPLS